MQFYYVYKALAHPETNGYITPYTLQERLIHVAVAESQLGSRIPWLADSMDNELKHALGDAPNSEFVIDPDGTIVVARPWSKPDELRADLAELVGEVQPATTVAELQLPPLKPPQTVAKGVVPRIQLPAKMMAVTVEPLTDSETDPYYVKLRAEVNQSALQGDGKLYLGFFLDPLYKVHWNNRADPLHFEIETPENLSITPAFADAPQIAADADADPREFLLDISGESAGPLTITVYYFACDDAQTFCRPVKQQYLVTLQRDRDGGLRRDPRARSGNNQQRNPAAAMAVTQRLVRALDRNRDRQISATEIDEAADSLRQLDRNRNGQLDPEELGRD